MNELSVLIEEARDIIPEAIKSAAEKTANTAVGYLPKFSGQLRMSTNIGFNEPDLSIAIAALYVRNFFTGTRADAARRFASTSQGYMPGDTIFISNNQPYASDQEWNAGHLAFTRAAAEFQSDLDEALREAQ